MNLYFYTNSILLKKIQLFNPVGWDCWISAAPLGCKETWQLEEGEVSTCERGDNGSIYQWAFYYVPLWIVIILVSLLEYWIYATVRKQEKSMEAYDFAQTVNPESRRRITEDARIAASKKKLSQSKRVAEQAMCYVGAFLVTWLFPTIFQLSIVISGTHPFPLLFLTALLVPIQGVLNLIVFIRPKFKTYRRRNPDGYAIVAWFCMLYSEITTNTTNNTTPLDLTERQNRISILLPRIIDSLKSTRRKTALPSAEEGEKGRCKKKTRK